MVNLWFVIGFLIIFFCDINFNLIGVFEYFVVSLLIFVMYSLLIWFFKNLLVIIIVSNLFWFLKVEVIGRNSLL